MSARHKINSLIFVGVLVVGGVVGLIADSGWAFGVATFGLLAAAAASGDIRLR